MYNSLLGPTLDQQPHSYSHKNDVNFSSFVFLIIGNTYMDKIPLPIENTFLKKQTEFKEKKLFLHLFSIMCYYMY